MKEQQKIIVVFMTPICVATFIFLACNMYLKNYINRVNLEKYKLEAKITRSYRGLILKHPQIYINDKKPDTNWVNDFRGM